MPNSNPISQCYSCIRSGKRLWKEFGYHVFTQSFIELFPSHPNEYKQKFGGIASKNVISIAKAFGTRQEEHLFREVDSISPPACKYLMPIDPKKWRSSEWLQDTDLPPRFGITTSNSSEFVNRMIDAYRNEGYMELIEGLLDHITQMISRN